MRVPLLEMRLYNDMFDVVEIMRGYSVEHIKVRRFSSLPVCQHVMTLSCRPYNARRPSTPMRGAVIFTTKIQRLLPTLFIHVQYVDRDTQPGNFLLILHNANLGSS
jgi:hypothetical protein